MRLAILAIVLIAYCTVLARAESRNESDSNNGVARARIAAARQVVEQKLAAEEAACYRKFAANDCLSEARSRRRQALADLRRQEVALNDAERRYAAAVRQQRLDAKTSGQAMSGDTAVVARSERVRPERKAGNPERHDGHAGEREGGRRASSANSTAVGGTATADLRAQRAADAAKRAQMARARTQDARERQAKAHNQAKLAGKPTGTSLPTPP